MKKISLLIMTLGLQAATAWGLAAPESDVKADPIAREALMADILARATYTLADTPLNGPPAGLAPEKYDALKQLKTLSRAVSHTALCIQSFIEARNLGLFEDVSESLQGALQQTEVSLVRLLEAHILSFKNLLPAFEGWPKISVYGERADLHAFRILTAMGLYVPFYNIQSHIAQRLHKLAKQGETNPHRFAPFFDSLCQRDQLNQFYGTILMPGAEEGTFKFYPYEGTWEEMNRRRMKLGLHPYQASSGEESLKILLEVIQHKLPPESPQP